jgi:hypothetical protein
VVDAPVLQLARRDDQVVRFGVAIEERVPASFQVARTFASAGCTGIERTTPVFVDFSVFFLMLYYASRSRRPSGCCVGS